MIIKVSVLLVYDKERTISLFFKYLGDSHILIDKPIVRYTICNIMLHSNYLREREILIFSLMLNTSCVIFRYNWKCDTGCAILERL